MTDKLDILVKQFTQRYIDVLSEIKGKGLRSYGFEYEFLPTRSLSMHDMTAVSQLLLETGFSLDGNEYLADNGFRVAFEPGGQIEYCSPPLLRDDDQLFDSLLAFIDQSNKTIRDHLDIEYIGTDYMPGRAQAPLCLISNRYVKLHNRLAEIDTRGLEMMKGTASIHLHVGISNINEILPLFNFLCKLSTTDEFKMSRERRDIWNHTDSSRCGRPPCCFAHLESSEELIKRLIHFALNADVLGEDIAFVNSADQSFKKFLYHMTTLFTDVRFNLKGPTLEMRTLDSMPLAQFKIRWKRFVYLFENM
ncbi:MAG: hypothetical protein HF978_16215 [Desulfobacteraceae bacterium]|nr:hypothetical protein [Desulfobacteraceae bacterium]MBC2757088.1 hypothetical protein [Desulfobacteraceae bacterium]MBC2763695.1 hypothetical protein [ANME-2 cluster archaeon]